MKCWKNIERNKHHSGSNSPFSSVVYFYISYKTNISKTRKIDERESKPVIPSTLYHPTTLRPTSLTSV